MKVRIFTVGLSAAFAVACGWSFSAAGLLVPDCREDRAALEKLVASMPNGCEQDSDCGCYDYLVFPDAGPVALRHPGATSEMQLRLSELQSRVRRACGAELEAARRRGPRAVFSAKCSSGRCERVRQGINVSRAPLLPGWLRLPKFRNAKAPKAPAVYVYKPPLYQRILGGLFKFLFDHPLAAAVFSMAGFWFGRLRGYWEEGLPARAYPAAVRLSNWAGIIGAAVVAGWRIRGLNPDDPLSGLFFPAILFLMPAVWFLVAGFTRPFFYLGALFYCHFAGEKDAA